MNNKVLKFKYKRLVIKSFILAATCFASVFSVNAYAQKDDDLRDAERYLGLFTTREGDAVVQTRLCKKQSFQAKATALCGKVVWAKDTSDCGRTIAQFGKFEDGLWRDGWIFNVRDKRTYNAEMLAAGGENVVRIYIGNKTQSKEVYFNRVKDYPRETCRGKRPSHILIK